MFSLHRITDFVHTISVFRSGQLHKHFSFSSSNANSALGLFGVDVLCEVTFYLVGYLLLGFKIFGYSDCNRNCYVQADKIQQVL